MQGRDLVHKIEEILGKAVKSASDEGPFPHVCVDSEALKALMSFCVNDLEMKFDFLENLTGMDWGTDLGVIYQLYSTDLAHRLSIKVSVERHSPRLPSVAGFWRAALAYEREAAEMFGLVFDGHPDPRHLLLPDDWAGHPLRKDYAYPEEYHGTEHRRAPLRKEHAKP
jgi:NADH-quinone oxidoreductase subunit C